MTVKTFKLVLPTGPDFIRHISTVMLLNTQAGIDTETELPPLVSRAKTLVNKDGFILGVFETGGSNGG